MNLILKSQSKYLVKMDSMQEFYLLEASSPLYVKDAPSIININFYPTQNKNEKETKKILPKSVCFWLTSDNTQESNSYNKKIKLNCNDKSIKITHFNDSCFEANIKDNNVISAQNYKDTSVMLEGDYAETEIYFKNFGQSEVLMLKNNKSLASFSLRNKFCSAHTLQLSDFLVCIFNNENEKIKSEFKKLGKEKIFEIGDTDTKFDLLILNLQTLQQELYEPFNIMEYCKDEKNISILQKDDSPLKTGTLIEIIFDDKAETKLDIKKDKVFLNESGTVKDLIPSKLIPYTFFKAIKSENFKEARYFLEDSFNKKLTNEDLSLFFKEIYEISYNDFAEYDSDYLYAKTKNNDCFPISFVVEKNKITNIKA